MTAPRICRAGQMPGTTAQNAHVPVVVVGGGACGLTAALMLHDAGVDCAVLERDATPTGSTALSSGFIPAPGTQAQRAAGIEDSPARFAADITAKAKGRAAPQLVAAYAQAIGPALDALQVRHGLQWQVLDGFLYPGHSALRMHATLDKTGAGLMGRLANALAAAEVPLVLNATVRELWVNAQQRVIGVGYEQPGGAMQYLSCDAVILACNGFGGNAAMVQALLPEMRDALFAGHAGNDGSAIAWGKALGARLADLGGYQGHGSWAIPQGALISWALMMEGGIQLNGLGERFHDETQGYSEASVHVLAQPGGVAWNVFDEPLLALARSFPDFVAAEAAGALKRCDSLQALAAVIGCEESKLIAIFLYTAGGEGQIDAVKRTFSRPLQAPFYAVKVTGALFHTQGGLDIDARCRVLDTQGQPFPNLLAAGGAARGVSGDAVWGYLSGNGLLSAIAGGYIAAHTAAQRIAHGGDFSSSASLP
ncbi:MULTISPECIES: FAD-dependent oxidoreductase [unclassified Polaromonas]|uniref:FAD-dependent oxidoreductase n=1 Tax=unclassified Polaromonas TaxID=2638319 RepID=UPI0018CAB139|nr:MULTISPECIES: FAD-dependent oxidoreductase [unclassified Polaromonas]MBG6073883.1 fumarate reductase flavoprotein subunit [Polaromonas sp. CG_9.7]MBG6115742.1 fumarate reductase flavoprotein subunit [Polaromonas sp. CG_9.2]MDH6185935.1 fumarate reductase flavoprotein subunit [Polaromonas sp. CG_23.6]